MWKGQAGGEETEGEERTPPSLETNSRRLCLVHTLGKSRRPSDYTDHVTLNWMSRTNNTKNQLISQYNLFSASYAIIIIIEGRDYGGVLSEDCEDTEQSSEGAYQRMMYKKNRKRIKYNNKIKRMRFLLGHAGANIQRRQK